MHNLVNFSKLLNFFIQFRTSSNETVSNYVRHVFVMAPGVLTLVGFLLVLFFQPSNFICKSKGKYIVKLLDVYNLGNVRIITTNILNYPLTQWRQAVPLFKLVILPSNTSLCKCIYLVIVLRPCSTAIHAHLIRRF